MWLVAQSTFGKSAREKGFSSVCFAAFLWSDRKDTHLPCLQGFPLQKKKERTWNNSFFSISDVYFREAYRRLKSVTLLSRQAGFKPCAINFLNCSDAKVYCISRLSLQTCQRCFSSVLNMIWKTLQTKAFTKHCSARDHTGGSGPEAANPGSRIPSAWPPREFPGDRKVRCKTPKGGSRFC